MDKWGRHFILQVNPASANQVNSEQIIIQDPFTIEFDIRREALSTASVARINVKNLAESTRRSIYKDPFDTTLYRQVILRAGYDTNPPVIFRGNILLAKSGRREGSSEIETEITAYDGGWDFSNSYVDNLTLGPYSSRENAIRQLSGHLQHVRLGTMSDFPEIYPRGKSFMGNALELIREETKNNFFIDGETLHCLKANDCIDGAVLVISSDTGLLGSPQRHETYVVCEMLFEPRLVIGQQVQLITTTNRDLQNTYKVVGVEHYGIISNSVSGKCKTRVSLWLGSESLTVIGQTAYWGLP